MVNVCEVNWNNQKVYLLENDKLKLWVAPDDGMNISQIEYDNQVVVKFEMERFEKKQTHSVPVLYPTPNRVRNWKFSFEGNEYDAVMHGFTKNQRFEEIKILKDDSEASIEGVLKITRGNASYEMFPYESALKIKITAARGEIRYKYTVCNYSDKKLPYGFAIHPFFHKNGEDVQIQVNAADVMGMSEDKLPTGELIKVENTGYDLRQPAPVGSLNLDHVYTGIFKQPAAMLKYKNFSIELRTTDDFSHIVVFTPPKEQFFCIENQTCSTDAHNMYNMGYEDISGLEIVSPSKEKSGEITIKFIQE